VDSQPVFGVSIKCAAKKTYRLLPFHLRKINIKPSSCLCTPSRPVSFPPACLPACLPQLPPSSGRHGEVRDGDRGVVGRRQVPGQVLSEVAQDRAGQRPRTGTFLLPFVRFEQRLAGCSIACNGGTYRAGVWLEEWWRNRASAFREPHLTVTSRISSLVFRLSCFVVVVVFFGRPV